MKNIIGTLSVGFLCGLSGFLGCQGQPQLATEYVEGVVTLDGTPVEGATVQFQPVTAGQGMSATGFTDEKGVYKLTAVGGGEDAGQPGVGAGTLPGEYFVSVQKAESETVISQEEAESSGQSADLPQAGKNPKMTYHVPRKYQNARKSGLKVVVKEGENNIPLELTSN